MATQVQISAWVSQELKRRTFAALALQGKSFSSWLQARMAEFVQEQEEREGE